jgi:hypothetical protein
MISDQFAQSQGFQDESASRVNTPLSLSTCNKLEIATVYSSRLFKVHPVSIKIRKFDVIIRVFCVDMCLIIVIRAVLFSIVVEDRIEFPR